MTHAEREAFVLRFMQTNAARLDAWDYDKIAASFGWGRSSLFDTVSRLQLRGRVACEGTGAGRLPFVLTGEKG